MRVDIQKAIALDEMVRVTVEIDPENLDESWKDILKVMEKLDDRYTEMNLRVIKANEAVKKMDPEGKIAVMGVFETLRGRPFETGEGEDA